MNEVSVTLVIIVPSQDKKDVYEIKKVPEVVINLDAPFSRVKSALINKIGSVDAWKEWASRIEAESYDLLISAREGTPRNGTRLEDGAFILLFPLVTDEDVVRIPGLDND